MGVHLMDVGVQPIRLHLMRVHLIDVYRYVPHSLLYVRFVDL
jgi:hypothetical protein